MGNAYFPRTVVLFYILTNLPYDSFQQNPQEKISVLKIIGEINSTLTNEIQVLTDRLNDAELNVTYLELKAAKLQTENTGLNEKLALLEEKYTNVTSQCNRSRNSLKMELDITQTNLESLRNDTRLLQDQNENATKQYSDLKAAIEKIENEVGQTKNGLILPLISEVTVLKLNSKESRITERELNETASRLEKQLDKINITLVKELSEVRKNAEELKSLLFAGKDDLTALHNTVIETERSVTILKAKISDFHWSHNNTDSAFSSSLNFLSQEIKALNDSYNNYLNSTLFHLKIQLEQKFANTTIALNDKFKQDMSELNANINSNMTALESKLTANIQKVKGENTLLNFLNKAVHQVGLSVSQITRNLSRLENLFDTQIATENSHFEKISRDINALEQNQTEALKEMSSNLSESILLVRTSLDEKIIRLHKDHNSSIETIVDMCEFAQNKTDIELEKFSSSQKNLIANLTALDKMLHEMGVDQNKKVDEMSKACVRNITNLKILLRGEVQNFKDNTTSAMNRVTRANQELEMNLSKNTGYLNASIQGLSNDIRHLELQNHEQFRNHSGSLEQLRRQMMNDISKVNKELRGEIERFNKQNESISRLFSTILNELKVLQTNLAQSVHTIEQEHDNLVNETHFQEIIRMLMETHNASIKDVKETLNDLKTKSENVDGNLTQAVYQLSARTSYNLSELETRLREALHKFVDSENLRLRGYTNRMDTMNAAVNRIASDLARAEERITENNEKVGLLACSTNRQLSRGSKIQFPNIKNIYGVQDNTSFILTGKFQCEKPGLYIISAQIMSNSRGAEYAIKINDNEYSRVQITPYHVDPTNHNYHTGTGLAVVELQKNDEAWVEVLDTDLYMFGRESCMNIIKVK